VKDALDQWWEWANKPLYSYLTVPTELRETVIVMRVADKSKFAALSDN